VRTGMNAGEAQHRRGAKGVNRFDDAMGEAREAYTGLGMARAFEYVDEELCTEVIDKVDGGVDAILSGRLAHDAGCGSSWAQLVLSRKAAGPTRRV